jgi:hypothetical protein
MRIAIRERAILAYFKLEELNAYRTGIRMEFVSFAALHALFMEMFPGIPCEPRTLYDACIYNSVGDLSGNLSQSVQGQFVFQQHPIQTSLLMVRFVPDLFPGSMLGLSSTYPSLPAPPLTPMPPNPATAPVDLGTTPAIDLRTSYTSLGTNIWPPPANNISANMDANHARQLPNNLTGPFTGL